MRERGKRTKKGKSYSIDGDVCKEFDLHCEDICANPSRLVEKLIKEYLKKQNGKKR
jgi:metal-responsive CopG/Arc/MetJ family transcriptional regulator